MSAPLSIVKPGIVGLASYDSKGRWVKWSHRGLDDPKQGLFDFFISLGWRWIPELGAWYDEDGNPAVAYYDGKKVEYPMEKWS